MYPIFKRPEVFSINELVDKGIASEIWYTETPYSFIEVLLQNGQLLTVLSSIDSKERVENIFNNPENIVELDKLGDEDVYIIIVHDYSLFIIESNVINSVPSYGRIDIYNISEELSEILSKFECDLVSALTELICNDIRQEYCKCDINNLSALRCYRVFSIND